MKKHYLEDLFLSEILGQSMRSIAVVASVAGLLILGLSGQITTDFDQLTDALALLNSRG